MVHSLTMVIGAKGFIGRHFFTHYKSLHPGILATHHSPLEGLLALDLTSPAVTLPWHDYSYVLIAAGMTNPAQCERDKEKSFQCNVMAPLLIAKECLQKGCIPIFFSTDYVFDGTRAPYHVDDPLSPLNTYGKHKAELERRALDLTQGNCLMIRLSKVYSFERDGKTLLSEMVEKFKKNEEVKAAHDQVFAPIYIQDVVEGVVALQRKGARGIYHFAGPKEFSRYELAKLVAQKIGAQEYLLRRISLDDLSEGFKRPKNTTLISHMGKVSIEEAIGRLI